MQQAQGPEPDGGAGVLQELRAGSGQRGGRRAGAGHVVPLVTVAGAGRPGGGRVLSLTGARGLSPPRLHSWGTQGQAVRGRGARGQRFGPSSSPRGKCMCTGREGRVLPDASQSPSSVAAGRPRPTHIAVRWLRCHRALGQKTGSTFQGAGARVGVSPGTASGLGGPRGSQWHIRAVISFC